MAVVGLICGALAAGAAHAAGATDAAETAEPTARAFVRGGIYDKPYLNSAADRLSIGGYADAQFRYHRLEGVLEETTFELKRFNLFTHAHVSERVRVAAEIEIEEGGEEIKLELAVMDFQVHPALTFRGGILLSPLGRFNLAHDSPANEVTDRPLVSTELLGTTLSEAGMGVLGSFHPSGRSRVTYEAYLTNGFSDGVVSGDGAGPRVPAGKGNWEDENARPAFVGRLAISPDPAVEAGVSYHVGPYNTYRVEGVDVDTRRDVRVLALDAEGNRGRWRLGGEYARVSFDLPPAFPFPDRQQGFYTELSAAFWDGRIRSLPQSGFRAVARWGFVDFDADGPGDDQRRVTLGLNFRPHPDTVFKLDWQRNWERDPFETEENAAAFLFSVASYF